MKFKGDIAILLSSL